MTVEPTTQGTSQWGPLASWGERVIATLIDAVVLVVGYIIIAIVAFIFGVVSDTLGFLVGTLGYLVMVAYSFYIYYMTGARGSSPGKRLTGLKVVRLTDGQVIGGGMGVVRGLAHVLDSFCLIGYLFPLFDANRQTFADKVIGTVALTGQPKESFSPEIFKL